MSRWSAGSPASSTTGGLCAGLFLLINGETDERSLDDWRGDCEFAAAIYKIAKNSVRFDPRVVCVRSRYIDEASLEPAAVS
jgi:hypothetical protein